jgi:hypothetical protein
MSWETAAESVPWAPATAHCRGIDEIARGIEHDVREVLRHATSAARHGRQSSGRRKVALKIDNPSIAHGSAFPSYRANSA